MILFLILCVMFIVSLIRKKPLPKKMLIATLSGVVITSLVYFYETYFFTFNDIDRTYMQEGPGPVMSPSEKYSAHAYYEPYGGAAGGVNVWVEVTNKKEDHVQIVYYADAKDQFSLEWRDDETLFILNDDPQFPNSNRSIELKVEKEIYHEFGRACKSLLMKDEYERCYHN